MADEIKRPSPTGGRSQSTAPSACIHASPGPEMMATRPPFQAPGSQSLKFKPERNSAPEAGRLSRSAPSFLIYRGRVGRPCRFPGQQVPEGYDRGYKSGYQLCPPVSSGSSKLREIRDVASSKTRFTALSAPISNDPPTRYFRNGARYIGNRITVQWEHRTGYFRNGQTVLRERAKFPDS